MPAAATRIKTSPARNVGSGRIPGLSTSGPPGSVISMQVMVSGKVSLMRALLLVGPGSV